MGLDQYAVARKAEYEDEELMYWRKHNRLQGWMEELWYDTGNKGVFYCVDLILTKQDILDLEEDIKGKKLPKTSGFFYGLDSYEEYEEYYKKADLLFIKRAKEAIKAGKEVIYSCWW